MERGESLYSGNAWFKDHLNGPDERYWREARKKFLFNQDLSSALNLFKFDYKAIRTVSRPEGTILIGSRNTTLNPDEKREYRAGQSWADDAQDSIRTLLDRIVTRWIPNYMNLPKISIEKLHRSLTPTPLQFVPTVYDTTNQNNDSFDVSKALALYQACLVPLHYHELWSEIVNDFKSVEVSMNERETVINTDDKLFYDKMTLDNEEETVLIFGTNRVTYTDNFKPLSKKLGLFDIVLITVDNVKYFGMIVHVEQTKVKPLSDEIDLNPNAASNDTHNKLRFDIHTTTGVYVSRICSDAIKASRRRTNDNKLAIAKLSNITSSRRMISAIHSLQDWPQRHSILKPTLDDPYFQLPEEYDPLSTYPSNGFNEAQSKTIAIAEYMFDDMQDRMHIVHGPPGTGKSRTIAGIVLKLLSKLPESGRKQKILLCAPSNNACDELCRRILAEFHNQDVSYVHGTLVRIGCQPPDDYNLCDHFLDFMVLQDIVNVLKSNEKPSPNIAQETEMRFMRRAKIIVSTLNYCGSGRMNHLKSSTKFIIIDEASQSLEADFLLPLRFKCTKLILVGDPNQLPPCVLSDAGKTYGLSRSLYARLFSIFDQDSNGPISMLDTQYRMHRDICEFPSAYFYSNRLSTHESVAIRMKDFPLKPLYLYNMTKSVQVLDDARSSLNKDEAERIRAFCESLIVYLALQPSSVFDSSEDRSDSGSDAGSDDDDDDDDDDESDTTSLSKRHRSTDEDSEHEEEFEKLRLQPLSSDDPRSIEIQQRIAVITPYKAQVRLLRSYLPPFIEIMTIDSSQGKEKDIVILSCVRNSSTIGFLDDQNRLNVMLTRSKNALYIFGNLTQLASQDESWKALVEHAQKQKIISDVNNISVDLPYRQNKGQC